MNGVFKHPLRVGARMMWLSAELIWATINFVLFVVFRSGSSSLEARAFWLQAGSRRVLRIFNAEIRTTGPIPQNGLLISNHLSYLDILVLSALAPSVFVAKAEVAHWPIFGWFARRGGTLFADRTRRCQVGPLIKALQTTLAERALVVLFPEGTSSDGQTVLPFKSSLLEPATRCSRPLSASFIEYRLKDGHVGEEVCYWRDMIFGPHLLNLLSKNQIEVSVRFSRIREDIANRKELARRMHVEVLRLKELLL